jgi:hypothetical protein
VISDAFNNKSVHFVGVIIVCNVILHGVYLLSICKFAAAKLRTLTIELHIFTLKDQDIYRRIKIYFSKIAHLL